MGFKTPDRKYTYPFILSAFIVIVDQITKALVATNIELYQVGYQAFGDFFRIIHVRNHGIAFSVGNNLPEVMRSILFIAIPAVVVIVVVIYYFLSKELDTPMRWALAGIIGGGVGNLIDRVARPAGVVDFVDVKFYGLFGLERWPTFNIADMSVVVASVSLIVFMWQYERRLKSEQES